MLPDRVSNPGPLTYESGALPTALRGPACNCLYMELEKRVFVCMSILPLALCLDGGRGGVR